MEKEGEWQIKCRDGRYRVVGLVYVEQWWGGGHRAAVGQAQSSGRAMAERWKGRHRAVVGQAQSSGRAGTEQW